MHRWTNQHFGVTASPDLQETPPTPPTEKKAEGKAAPKQTQGRDLAQQTDGKTNTGGFGNAGRMWFDFEDFCIFLHDLKLLEKEYCKRLHVGGHYCIYSFSGSAVQPGYPSQSDVASSILQFFFCVTLCHLLLLPQLHQARSAM